MATETNKPRTIKQTLQRVRELGMSASYNSNTGEYRVNYREGTEQTAYYTTCGEDAIGTARFMVQNPDFSLRIKQGPTEPHPIGPKMLAFGK
jgi:hypothetical protein